jgi:nicotinamide mononucleotide (NMN) deamidase PncC
MASGAMTAAKADVGVAITGVAGPDPAEGFPVASFSSGLPVMK